MSRDCIMIFTDRYPYGEATFLKPEIDVLLDEFKQVIVVPMRKISARSETDPRLIINEDFAIGKYSVFLSALQRPTTLLSQVVSETIEMPKGLLAVGSVRLMLIWDTYATHIYRVLMNMIRTGKTDPDRTVYYSYWLDGTALGLGLVRKRVPGMKLVSRAHRFDIYEEERNPSYLPMRAETLKNLDLLCPISTDGGKYLKRKYKSLVPRVKVSRLGTPDPGFISRPSTDGSISLASCSNLHNYKRPFLLVDSVADLARTYKDEQIFWTHFGDGPDRQEFEKKIQGLPNNVESNVAGHVDIETIYSFYRNNPVDFFLNTSSSEGVPVSIMEALSCGIPVIAPDVGGVAEILDDSCGRVLEENFVPTTVSSAVAEVIKSDLAGSLRSGARKRWEERCSADKNYREFAKTLSEL